LRYGRFVDEKITNDREVEVMGGKVVDATNKKY
jgi:hypothetical protein